VRVASDRGGAGVVSVLAVTSSRAKRGTFFAGFEAGEQDSSLRSG
jgi:hypothetical protein